MDPIDGRASFVEAVGVAMAAQGLPRNAGRVLGALLVASPPERTAEELASELQASRGSISTMTRLLEGTGIIARVSKPGDRRHYYRVRRGGLAAATAARVRGMRRMTELLEEGLRLLDDAPPASRQALEEMHDFYGYWADETLRLAEAYLADVTAGRRPRPRSGGPAFDTSSPDEGTERS